jgi:hypothetical protein
MAKKNTYAAMMKQLTSKKAQYEKGLEEARRTNNRSGVADYERRLTKLNAGMDELFQAQEMSKAPTGGNMFGLGGSSLKRYNDGGFTLPDPNAGDYWNQIQALKQRYTDAFIAAKGGGVSSEDKQFMEWFRNNEAVLQAPNAATARAAQRSANGGTPAGPMPAASAAPRTVAADGSVPGAATNAAGEYMIMTDPQSGKEFYLTPQMLTNLENGAFGQFLQMGNYKDDFIFVDGPTNAPVEPDPVVTPTPEPTPAPSPTTSTTAAAPRMSAADAQASVMAKFGDRLPGGGPAAWRNDPLYTGESNAVVNDLTDATSPTDGMTQDEILKTASDMNRATNEATAPADSPSFMDRAKSFTDSIGSSGLGMIAGAAAQFVPDLIAKRRMQNIQGPVAAPMMRYAAGNTDIDTGAALSAIRNQTAQANEAVDRNFANPQVAAAMKRANMNQAQANLGQVLSNEAAQELQLRNQELQRGTDVSNQNRMLAAQNVQAQRDFENQRLTAMNRMDMQMGQKLGGLYTDFQNRAQDRAKWDMYSKIFNEDMLKRQDIDPTA